MTRPLARVAPVVGREVQHVGRLLEFLDQHHLIARARAHDRDDLVPRRAVGRQLRQERCGPETPADAEHGAGVAVDFDRAPERPDDVEQAVEGIEPAHRPRRVPHDLDHQADPGALPVHLRDGQRDTFAQLTNAYDHELAGAKCGRDVRRLDPHRKDAVAQPAFVGYPKILP